MKKPSNLLEFHNEIVSNKKAIFNINTSELNPEGFEGEEVERTKEMFPVSSYSLVDLREYILSHSNILHDSGNIIKGEIVNDEVILTALKQK